MTAFHAIVALIARYGLLGIATSMIVENLGIPFPTEGAFLVSQDYIIRGVHSFWSMYVFITLSQIAGAIIAYFLGRWLKDLLLRWFSKSEDFRTAQKKIEHWYKEYGSVTVFITRLIGYIRPWSSLIAGFAEYPPLPFLLWTVLGTALFVYPTMKATGYLFLIWARYPALHPLIAISMLTLFSALFIYSVIHRSKKKKGGE